MKPVLLIDTQAYGIAEAISEYVERNIIPARNIGDAETQMRNEEISAIVLDPMVQYGWDGGNETIPTFLEAVRKRDIPVVVYTTTPMDSLKEWKLEPGLHYDDYVSKTEHNVDRLKASLDTLIS